MGTIETLVGPLASLIPFYAKFSRETWEATRGAVDEISSAFEAAWRSLDAGASYEEVASRLPVNSRITEYEGLFDRALDEKVIRGESNTLLLRSVRLALTSTKSQLLLVSMDGSPESVKRIQAEAARLLLEMEIAASRSGSVVDECEYRSERDRRERGPGLPEEAAGGTHPLGLDTFRSMLIIEMRSNVAICGRLVRYLNTRERYAR